MVAVSLKKGEGVVDGVCENELIDKYENWQKELEKREKAVEEREKALDERQDATEWTK